MVDEDGREHILVLLMDVFLSYSLVTLYFVLTGAMSFSTTGILVTLFVAGVFVRHNDTPVVKAAGRELSYVLLIGIFLCYSVTFALVLRPTNTVCGLQR